MVTRDVLKFICLGRGGIIEVDEWMMVLREGGECRRERLIELLSWMLCCSEPSCGLWRV